jgi:hypothetical protein
VNTGLNPVRSARKALKQASPEVQVVAATLAQERSIEGRGGKMHIQLQDAVYNELQMRFRRLTTKQAPQTRCSAPEGVLHQAL